MSARAALAALGLGPALVLTGCVFDKSGDTGGELGSYSAVCSHELPGEPILDASGTFAVTDVDGAPASFAVGTHLDGTGGLDVVACVPDRENDPPILDDLVLSIGLALFDFDDGAMDLGIGDDADGVNVLTGTASDWHDIVPWDEGGTFMTFEGGVGSFSEIDKDGGRLVGVIDVTETDPRGYDMQIEVDLSW